MGLWLWLQSDNITLSNYLDRTDFLTNTEPILATGNYNKKTLQAELLEKLLNKTDTTITLMRKVTNKQNSSTHRDIQHLCSLPTLSVSLDIIQEDQSLPWELLHYKHSGRKQS